MGIGYIYTDCDSQKLCLDGNPHARGAIYALFKVWLLVVEDWVLSHTHTMPDNLGLTTIHAMACLTMTPDVYSWLETGGMLGTT